MEKKKIIIAISVIAAIALAYFGYKWYEKNKKPKPNMRPTLVPNSMPAPAVPVQTTAK
jgi:uncharacterized membrane protein YebE (DUF533 family)